MFWTIVQMATLLILNVTSTIIHEFDVYCMIHAFGQIYPIIALETVRLHIWWLVIMTENNATYYNSLYQYLA